ncbi:MAG: hypothetical protein GEU76_15590 [Alphaproteobacteria bacterium]|nr:hypothetical protein [Alphaproteobacteria bacterium]
MHYAVVGQSKSRSFPEDDPFLGGAGPTAEADILIILGGGFGAGPTAIPDDAALYRAVLVELGTECLSYHTGADGGPGNLLGFARYRIGELAPSPLVELVRGPGADDGAVATAEALFGAHGFVVAVCSDQAGRIVDRLVRPKYNSALRFLDEGLATQEAMDLTCRLGLGYPEGPIERVRRSGIEDHYRVSLALFEVYGTPAYTPAAGAVMAARRREHGL